MTDTAKRKNESIKSNNGSRSAHPAYTEYDVGRAPHRSVSPSGAYNRSAAYDRPQRNAFAGDRQMRNAEGNVRRVTTLDDRRANLNDRNRRALEAQRAEQRRVRAQKLAAETKKRAEAAAKEASRRAKRTQAKVFRDLRRLNTIKLEDRYTFPVSIVMTAILFTVLIFAIVTTSVRISEITTENLALRRTYETLVSDENKLRMELEVRDDLRTVESLAKNEYGMVKQDQVERYYLKTYNADKIELIEEETVENSVGWIERVTDVLKSIGGRVLAFFGN